MFVKLYTHVGLVVAADLLDADVVFGLDVGFGGGVGPGQRHHAGNVLEVLLVLHFNLQEETPLVSQLLITQQKTAAARLAGPPPVPQEADTATQAGNEGSLGGPGAGGPFELRHRGVIRLQTVNTDCRNYVAAANQHVW